MFRRASTTPAHLFTAFFLVFSVRHRPHNLLMSLSHQSPAYMNEDYPIVINITNADDRELDVVADVLLQPSETDDAGMCLPLQTRWVHTQIVCCAVNSIILDNESSSGLIKGVAFGVLAPGVSVLKTLYLVNTGAAGDRMLDVSIQSRSTAIPEALTSESSELQDMSETLQTLIVPTVDPIKVTYGVEYRRALGPRAGLADLRTFEGEFWDDGDGGEAMVNARMECVGPWGLEVESIQLQTQVRAQL
jgi:hypothetical protein